MQRLACHQVDGTLSFLVGEVQVGTMTHQVTRHSNPLLVVVWDVITQLRVDLKQTQQITH